MKYILIGYFFCILLFVCTCNISFNRAEKSFGGDMTDILNGSDVNAKPIARIYSGEEVRLKGDTIAIKYGDKTTQYRKAQVKANVQTFR